MEFVSISIENFLTIGKIDLALNQPGMILIAGINKDAPKSDSNGSGKTAILDALCWALWGETSRGLTGDEVLRRHFGKDCRVAVTVQDDDNTYVITRHRNDTRIAKPNDLRLTVNGVEKTRKMKDLQATINTILGFDFIPFCAMMPGTGIRPALLTDVKIKELLEKLMQTEQFGEAHTAAKEKLKELEVKLNALIVREKSLNDSKASHEKSLAEIKDAQKNFEERKEQSILTKQQEVENLEARLIALEADIAKSEKLALEEHDWDIKHSIEKEELRSLVNSRDLYVSDWRERLRNLDYNLTVLQEQIRAIEESVNSLKAIAGRCTCCNQVVSEDHKQEEINRLLLRKSLLLGELQEGQTNITSYVNNFNARMYDIEHARKIIDQKIQHAYAKRNAAQVEKNACRVMDNTRTFLVSQIVKLNSELKDIRAQEDKLSPIIEHTEEELAKIGVELESLRKDKLDLESEKGLCEFWVKGFSPSGLRSYMLDYVTPVLNSRAAYYSDLLTGGEMKVVFSTKSVLKNGEEREKFQIQVEQKHGGELYKGNSNGEKARADLVISMALSDLAAYRTSKHLPWRFLDEPFENIDSLGVEAVANLLNDQKARYKTVFVVTHKLEFKQMFNQHITVIKENSVSRLENSDEGRSSVDRGDSDGGTA